MNQETRILQAYETAKQIYADYGVDVEAVVKHFDRLPICIPCWQGDDVGGFENAGGGVSGGIMATGNYPGKPRTPEELRTDIDKALGYIPGAVKINVHASYGEDFEKGIDRDEYAPRHFSKWMAWAKARGLALDFNATTFGHPKAADDMTISHPDKAIRDFWVRHMIATRHIAAWMGQEQGSPCVCNYWVQDGMKDIPASRMLYRGYMKDSFDQVFAEKISPEYTYDALEPKLFGIGVENYTVGSNDFYLMYHQYAKANGIGNTIINLDTGHFHPLENVSDKISSVMLFDDRFLAHFTRSCRWDSDHVVINDDTLNDMMREICRNGLVDKAFFGTDYFDGTINRIAAWTIGTRATKRALLAAMLEPAHLLKEAEARRDFTTRLALTDEFRSLPVNAVWEKYCLDKGRPVGADWLKDLKKYEADVMLKR